jgi:hypothetical protein
MTGAVLLLIGLTALTPPDGELYGSLRLGSEYLADVPVELTCGGATASTKTDPHGLYRLYTTVTGKCSISVTYGGQTSMVEIYAYATPVRYRLVLEPADGAYVLRSE